MADIRRVSDRFAVAPHLSVEDFRDIAAAGYTHVINNRPDEEAPDLMNSAQAAGAAKAAGLTYVYAPFAGRPTLDAVKAVMNAHGKTLAYCRSGTRSINAWAMAQASEGEPAEYIVDAAADAGYNLSGMTAQLKQLGAS
jgi:uncharacterized protein (TIGR01244 family)